MCVFVCAVMVVVGARSLPIPTINIRKKLRFVIFHLINIYTISSRVPHASLQIFVLCLINFLMVNVNLRTFIVAVVVVFSVRER